MPGSGSGLSSKETFASRSCNNGDMQLLMIYLSSHTMYVFSDAVEELECMASWKEGSFRFLVGLMQYPHPSSFEDRFRCFSYEKGNKFGSSRAQSNHSEGDERVTFRVAQSGDATCLGLTPYEGSKTLSLHRGKQNNSGLDTNLVWILIYFASRANKYAISLLSKPPSDKTYETALVCIIPWYNITFIDSRFHCMNLYRYLYFSVNLNLKLVQIIDSLQQHASLRFYRVD